MNFSKIMLLVDHIQQNKGLQLTFRAIINKNWHCLIANLNSALLRATTVFVVFVRLGQEPIKINFWGLEIFISDFKSIFQHRQQFYFVILQNDSSDILRATTVIN